MHFVKPEITPFCIHVFIIKNNGHLKFFINRMIFFLFDIKSMSLSRCISKQTIEMIYKIKLYTYD